MCCKFWWKWKWKFKLKKNYFDCQKWLLRKLYLKKRNLIFKKKNEENANGSMELWKALKSLGMKWGNVSQSKIALKKDGAIQFQPT